MNIQAGSFFFIFTCKNCFLFCNNVECGFIVADSIEYMWEEGKSFLYSGELLGSKVPLRMQEMEWKLL
uniref:Uncharacterized protein n=1 Tax=Physcomitrium patens TaxID=3218 RepID=A0A2K1JZA0_PHYPA|nr:hypothetical protein PHYPA_013969 [Physcomitrium patens]